MIRPAVAEDAAALAALYGGFVRESSASFETEAPDAEVMAERLAEVRCHRLPWLVFEQQGELLGFAFATPWKSRQAYARSVEASVYVQAEAHGRGIGSQLFAALLEHLTRLQIHAVVGGIALPNPVSIALVEKFGFEKVAHFREIGRKFDRWVDVAYWQRLLPPASSKDVDVEA
ncbi:MAG: N-acetyltransferase [Planctomycetota bacterium]|nr:MAG: N-acetyltransferase [Planctomycetota bacterium]